MHLLGKLIKNLMLPSSCIVYLAFFGSHCFAKDLEFTNIKYCLTSDNFALYQDALNLEKSKSNNEIATKKNEEEIDIQDALSNYKKHLTLIFEDAKITGDTISEFSKNVKYHASVRKLDQSQPEKRKTFDDYFSIFTKDSFDKMFQESIVDSEKYYSNAISDAESIFEVEREVIYALLMHETRFGRYIGNRKVIDALFTLAFDGRRRVLFETNLVDFLKLVDYGHVGINDIGSWAGAFGKCQFMPSTFMKYGIDYDGDGKIDLFNSYGDIFASTAHYLSSIGWEKRGGIATRVELPKDFDYCNVGIMDIKAKTLYEWKKMGIKVTKNGIGEKYFSDNGKIAWLVIPDNSAFMEDGSRPKAFLVYPNFQKILDWNRSLFFAITVAYLADRSYQILHGNKTH